MTGEVTPENFPVHFAVANEFKGTVHPFDQYQGPFVMIPGRNAGVRYFLSTDDGVVACWWEEDASKFSPSFTATDDPQDLVFAVEAFRDLIENGGTDEAPWNESGLIIDADGTLALLHSLSPYISGDDTGLPREQFLRYVADRITDDLPPRPEGQRFTFTGKLYYRPWAPIGAPLDKSSIETTLTIVAPSQEIAESIVRNYGMDSITLKSVQPA